MTCFILWISCYFRLVITFYYISWIDMATRRFCVAIPSIYRSSVGLNIGIHPVNNKRWQNALTKLFIILHHFIHKFYFYCWKKLKNVHFHSKIAWPPATYDIISRNHSNWPSLNLSQNVCKGWTNKYRKPQMLMFYHVGKKSEKPKGGGSHPPPPWNVQRLLWNELYIVLWLNSFFGTKLIVNRF